MTESWATSRFHFVKTVLSETQDFILRIDMATQQRSIYNTDMFVTESLGVFVAFID